MELGAQLYTLHDYCKDLKGFEESLKRVAEIGYKVVQVSGTCDYNPKWLKDKLDKYGLKCVLTHVKPWNKLVYATKYIIEDHDILDCKYIGLGSMPNGGNNDMDMEDVLNTFIETFKPVAKEIKDSGKYFMYHNHEFEFFKFKNGKTAFDIMLEEIPAEIMGITLDTYWVQSGGLHPAGLIRKLKGRCPAIHLKDFLLLRDRSEKHRFCACGDGNLDFAEILDACKYAGVEYALVEQDNCFGEDPFACLERSYKYLKSIGY